MSTHATDGRRDTVTPAVLYLFLLIDCNKHSVGEKFMDVLPRVGLHMSPFGFLAFLDSYAGINNYGRCGIEKISTEIFPYA